MGRAPPGDERVVLPVLEVAYESRGVTEPQHEAAVLEADRGVAVQLVATRPGVSPERERRSGELAPRASPGALDRVRPGAHDLLRLGECGPPVGRPRADDRVQPTVRHGR